MNPNDFYKEICDFSPNPEQVKVFNTLINFDISKNPLLLRLPCGYGKTESVVVPFLSQAITGKWAIAPRLIYVLPTRALCNQIRDRICHYSQRVEESREKIITVGIEHGASSLDPLFFTDICITTFDQFLYGYARSKSQVGRHVDIPAGAFANSFIVFDEAHLYSPYTHALMKAMLDILCHSGIPVVAMTATMPETLQNDLMDGHKHYTIKFDGSPLNERRISWELQDWSLLANENPSSELLNILDSDSATGQKVLIVANRVDIVQKLAVGLTNRGVNLIHSRFSAADRISKENKVIELLGKGSTNNKGIIISTQVCEVGLDISCDLLITECASADALVQRIGRVARWGGNGKVIIVNPEKSVPYSDKTLGDKGDFVRISKDYLNNNKRLDFTSWDDVTNFCNQMLYHVNYVEARNAMEQLFEATLYADSIPYNLSVRDEIYCTLFVTDNNENTNIPYGQVKPACFNVPFFWFKKFWGKDDGGKKKGLKIAVYDLGEQKIKDFSVKNTPKPFGIYAIQKSDCYDSDIGFKPQTQIDDEESCLIC
jgi:CRISPR-associated endonuclease/helicase Cas3